MVLPHVIHGDGGLCPHVTYDYKGRKTTAYGRICGGTIVNDSTVSDKIRQEIRRTGQPGDDAGHIIPRCWGGSGRSGDNIFPQHAAWNRSNGHMERDFGNWLAQSENHSIEFEYYFEYGGTIFYNPNRPSKYTVTIIKYIDGKMAEAPYKYTELNRDYTPADQPFIDQQTHSMHHNNDAPKALLSNAAKATAKGMVAVKGGGEVMKGISTAAVPVAAVIDVLGPVGTVGGAVIGAVVSGAVIGKVFGKLFGN
uniref:Type VII secretion system protein EssD-like domain-containing protein n=1 Tax=Panagrolaimus sp. PS1159 TaxID=55785 RepID=A0AC35GAF0_9BILA